MTRSLEQRLAKLETENRRMKLGGGAVLTVLGAMVLTGMLQEPARIPEEIRANTVTASAFKLVSGEELKGAWGVAETGEPALHLMATSDQDAVITIGEQKIEGGQIRGLGISMGISDGIPSLSLVNDDSHVNAFCFADSAHLNVASNDDFGVSVLTDDDSADVSVSAPTKIVRLSSSTRSSQVALSDVIETALCQHRCRLA